MGFVVGVWVSPVAAVAVALGVTLGARAPWWALLGTVAACAILAVAAALRLRAWSERHDAKATAQWAVQQKMRAEVIEPTPPRQVINNYFIDPAGVQMAAVIRSITGGDDHGIFQQRQIVEHAGAQHVQPPGAPRVGGDHRPAQAPEQEGPAG